MNTDHSLRKAAEANIGNHTPLVRVPSAEHLLHELQVHQIELEMQNETLRQAQIELEKSRDNYVKLYDFAPVGYITLTPCAIISKINLTGAALLGIDRNRLLNSRFTGFVAPEDSDIWHRHFMDVLNNNGKNYKHGSELRLLRGDGSHFFAELNCRYIEAGSKSVFVTFTDITERKQNETLLCEAQKKLAAIFEGTLDGILLVNTETRQFDTCNPAFCNMLGYSLEEISQLGVADIHPPQDIPFVIDKFERHVRGEAQLATDIPFKRKDGSVFYADIKSIPVNIGGKTYLVGIFHDTTRRRQIDAELQEHQQLLRELSYQNINLREMERKHIAREVHDELGQLLTALRIGISLLRIQFGGLNPVLMKNIMDMLSVTDKAIKGVRNVALSLRPPALDLGIIPAIEWLLGNYPAGAKTACTLQVDDTKIELDDACTVAIFRIVQESLTNVARHAEADNVKITVWQHDDNIYVKVCDDGKGFDLTALPARKSFGLLGIRERALAVGGKVEITSAPSKGTIIFINIPTKRKGDNS